MEKTILTVTDPHGVMAAIVMPTGAVQPFLRAMRHIFSGDQNDLSVRRFADDNVINAIEDEGLDSLELASAHVHQVMDWFIKHHKIDVAKELAEDVDS